MHARFSGCGMLHQWVGSVVELLIFEVESLRRKIFKECCFIVCQSQCLYRSIIVHLIKNIDCMKNFDTHPLYSLATTVANYALSFTLYFTHPPAKISLHCQAQFILEIGSCYLHNLLYRVMLVCLLLWIAVPMEGGPSPLRGRIRRLEEMQEERGSLPKLFN